MLICTVNGSEPNSKNTTHKYSRLPAMPRKENKFCCFHRSLFVCSMCWCVKLSQEIAFKTRYLHIAYVHKQKRRFHQRRSQQLQFAAHTHTQTHTLFFFCLLSYRQRRNNILSASNRIEIACSWYTNMSMGSQWISFESFQWCESFQVNLSIVFVMRFFRSNAPFLSSVKSYIFSIKRQIQRFE